jgi:hypothetical protein
VETPIEETRYLCPECRQYFPYEGCCDRCDKSLVDRTIALPASPVAVRPLGWLVPAHGSPGMVLLVVCSLLGPALLFEGSRNPEVRSFVGLALAAVVALLVAGLLVNTVLTRSRRRRSRERVRAEALSQPRVTAAALSTERAELVRMVGRLRFDVEPTGVRVRICDESGTALLPDRPWIRAYRADGAHEELDSVKDGDEVEVLAACRRVARAGNGYRQTDSALELSAEQPVLMWVRRARVDAVD